MIGHIRFCLDEIECEIEVQDVVGLSTVEQADIRDYIASMRAVLDRSELRRRNKKLGVRTDNLLLIRGIDAELSVLLEKNGIRRFSDISRLTAEGIAKLNAAGIGAGRINSENWIEQAAILATGKMTYFAETLIGSRVDCDADDSAPTEVATQTPALIVAASAVADRKDEPLPTAANDLSPVEVGNVAGAEVAQPAEPLSSLSRTVGRIAATLFIAAVLAGVQFVDLPAFASLASVFSGQ